MVKLPHPPRTHLPFATFDGGQIYPSRDQTLPYHLQCTVGLKLNQQKG